MPQLEPEDPVGRLDVLLIRFVDHLVGTRGDFTLRALHAKYKPYIDHCLREYCGPVRIPGLKPERIPAARKLRRKLRVESAPKKPAEKPVQQPAPEVEILDAEWEEVA